MSSEDRYKEFKQYLASVELGVEGRARNWLMLSVCRMWSG